MDRQALEEWYSGAWSRWYYTIVAFTLHSARHPPPCPFSFLGLWEALTEIQAQTFSLHLTQWLGSAWDPWLVDNMSVHHGEEFCLEIWMWGFIFKIWKVNPQFVGLTWCHRGLYQECHSMGQNKGGASPPSRHRTLFFFQGTSLKPKESCLLGPDSPRMHANPQTWILFSTRSMLINSYAIGQSSSRYLDNRISDSDI